jgi:tetratricopeptide (TPR) repeat protein
VTVEELLDAAENAWYFQNHDAARTLFQRAVDQDPQNHQAWDLFGAFLADILEAEQAIHALKKAIELSPESGWEKYMVLAQTTDDTEEAAAAARKGLQLIRQAKEAVLAGEQGEGSKHSNNEENNEEEVEEDPLAEVNRVLAHALCSLSELLLTHAIAAGVGSNPDAVLADEIVDECKAALKEASVLAPDDPDPLQALCNLLRLQGKREEALEALRKSMAFWFIETEDDDEEEEEEEEEDGEKEGEEENRKGKGAVDVSKRDHDDDDDDAMLEEEEDDDDDDNNNMPSYEHRMVTAHLLVELDEDMEKAIDLLLQLLEENDGDVEAWRLLAIAGREAGENEMAAHAAEQVLDLAAAYEMPAEEPLCAEMKELKEAMEKLMMQG